MPVLAHGLPCGPLERTPGKIGDRGTCKRRGSFAWREAPFVTRTQRIDIASTRVALCRFAVGEDCVGKNKHTIQQEHYARTAEKGYLLGSSIYERTNEGISYRGPRCPPSPTSVVFCQGWGGWSGASTAAISLKTSMPPLSPSSAS